MLPTLLLPAFPLSLIWIWLGMTPLASSTGARRCQHMEAIMGAVSR